MQLMGDLIIFRFLHGVLSLIKVKINTYNYIKIPIRVQLKLHILATKVSPNATIVSMHFLQFSGIINLEDCSFFRKKSLHNS